MKCPGGRMRSLRQSFMGPLAESALEWMSLDRVFLGADAVTVEYGICEADHTQTRLKELMARPDSAIQALASPSDSVWAFCLSRRRI